MNPHWSNLTRKFCPLLIAGVGLIGSVSPTHGAGEKGPVAPAASVKEPSHFFHDLLPTAWQKRPNLRFNVFTEMTSAGRERPEPTREKPLRYFAPAGSYVEMGWQTMAGERPPPWPQLREAVQAALAANGYNLIADDHQRPDVLIVFSFGAFSTDLAQLAVDPMTQEPIFPPPVTAEELLPYLMKGPLRDAKAVQDVIDRARFIGGGRVAEELRSALVFESSYNGPDGGSPVQLLLHGSGGGAVERVLELAFHTCYFVTATAFDFSGVEKKQKQVLWQTRMTVEAQGVTMDEVLKPLIINTGSYLGRETPEPIIVQKRISREGNVEVGTPTVVPEHAGAGSKDDAKK
ncbi:MAG: hypothetical protein ABIO94_10445 [Opitutaceae bacterium]